MSRLETREQSAPSSRASSPELLVVGLLILIALLRITATYSVFTQTNDEPIHIACGLEWISEGSYTIELLHPPLARAAAAVGPFLVGIPFQDRRGAAGSGRNSVEIGNDALHWDTSYFRNLALARAGILPFFVASGLLLWHWTRRLWGPTAALLSLGLFSNLPPILGHSGLATTDAALVATLSASLYCLIHWLDCPSYPHAALLGLTLGLAVLTKYSTVAFFPACAIAIVGLWWLAGRPSLHRQERLRRLVAQVTVALAIAFILVWAGFRFQLAPPLASPPRVLISRVLGNGSMAEAALRLTTFPVPAGSMLQGLESVYWKNRIGHAAFFFGPSDRQSSVWFFPVAFAVKTPIAFIVLFVLGIAGLVRRSRDAAWRNRVPLACCAALLGVAVASSINIGIRHVLPIYFFGSMMAGSGASWLVTRRNRKVSRLVAAGLVAWLVGASAGAHPDYLSYFNAFAGNHPERILVDSDLDWGQDLGRLAEALRRHRVRRVHVSLMGSADLERHNLPPFARFGPSRRPEGWVAISFFSLMTEPGYQWLFDYTPVEKVGRSILLFYLPPAPESLPAPEGRG